MDEPFDTKVAVVLIEDLPVWQKANAAAFLVSGIAGSTPPLVGEAYVDGSGNSYLPMLRQPILIYAADSPGIRRAYERAMAREVEQLAIFTRELFSTPNDTANRAAVAAVSGPGTRPGRHRSTRRSQDRRESPRQAATTFVTLTVSNVSATRTLALTHDDACAA
ncbi:MAG: DUF2000 family protein [Gaiellaceae bacterium]